MRINYHTTICGRECMIEENLRTKTRRYLVDGITLADGVRFIRFKSPARAERHIRNMGLSRD